MRFLHRTVIFKSQGDIYRNGMLHLSSNAKQTATNNKCSWKAEEDDKTDDHLPSTTTNNPRLQVKDVVSLLPYLTIYYITHSSKGYCIKVNNRLLYCAAAVPRKVKDSSPSIEGSSEREPSNPPSSIND